eukprot:TRINITY_DN12126_c0_g1_i1.p1 TRINITY_DN12126_c0_g1~~TRINITY_DN12126_c0_g1_i1.p1  ORF type:complete len:684 (+),score=234.05 TRINITY_DN12126_c0_g1_i1:184-2235(+)
MSAMKFLSALLLAGLQALLVASSDAGGGKNRPVSKVVNILKNMQETLEKEKEADEDMYEDLKCWCRETGTGKADEVKAAQVHIDELQASIDELNASCVSLATEMAGLAREVNEATATLDEARILHGNAVEKYNDDEKALYKDIDAVTNAATVIGAGTTEPAELLQTEGHDGRLQEIAAALKDAVSRRASLLENTISFRDHDKLEAFFKDPVAFVKQTSLLQSGSSGFGELEGLFQAMTEDFKVDLESVKQQLAKENNDYEALIKSKKDEIKAGEASIESKRQQRVQKKQDMTQKGFEIKDKRKAIQTAVEFVALAKEKCGDDDSDYQERQKMRQQEIEAVQEAIEILDGEEAHATFSRTYSFLQQAVVDTRMKRASQALQKVGRSQNDQRLLALAKAAEVKGMEKVIKAIDEMKVALKQEQADEVKQKDFCVASFNDIDAKRAEEQANKEKHSTQISTLTTKLNTIASDISETKGEIETALKNLKTETEEYNKEQKEFETTITDQASSTRLLKKALQALKTAYEEKPAGSLMQVEAPGDEVPAGFKDYKKNAQGSSILQLMLTVISDTQALQKETERAKATATKDFQKLQASTNDDVAAHQEGLDNLEAVKAKTLQSLSSAKTNLKGTEQALVNLAKEEAELKEDCDFLLKNFDLRKKARTEELEGLAQAKQILQGGSFLQKY